MASIAERRRNRKNRNVSRRAEAANNDNGRESAATATLVYRVKRQVRDDGLDYLQAKNRINKVQAEAGRRYGSLYRTSLISGAAALRSFLDDTPRGGGGAGLPTTDLEAAAWIADAKRGLADAQKALGLHEGMIAACDLVCGRGLRPREISDVQRETEEIETALRLALDLLARHFQRAGRLGD